MIVVQMQDSNPLGKVMISSIKLQPVINYFKNFLTRSAKQYVWLAFMDACISVCQLPYRR